MPAACGLQPTACAWPWPPRRVPCGAAAGAARARSAAAAGAGHKGVWCEPVSLCVTSTCVHSRHVTGVAGPRKRTRLSWVGDTPVRMAGDTHAHAQRMQCAHTCGVMRRAPRRWCCQRAATASWLSAGTQCSGERPVACVCVGVQRLPRSAGRAQSRVKRAAASLLTHTHTL
jgi:hypothetical protein